MSEAQNEPVAEKPKAARPKKAAAPKEAMNVGPVGQPLTAEEATPGTPEYSHRMKVIKEEKKRKAEKLKEGFIVDSWFELEQDRKAKKGGKLIFCQKTKVGHVYSKLVGFSKQPFIIPIIEKAQKEGKLRKV